MINLKPTGLVEVKKGLARHKVRQEVIEATKGTPENPRERPAVTAGLIRYAALQKSMAVQAALLANPRKAREVSAICLLFAFGTYHPVRIDVHQCIAGCGALEPKPKALTAVLAEASRLLGAVGMKIDERSGTVMGID